MHLILARAAIGGAFALALTATLAACGGGGHSARDEAPPPRGPNSAPVARSDVMRADGAALNSIAVLANDTDADSDALTVTIEEQPLVGTATVNADATVHIGGLPAGFKGVTRFKYRVTDTSNASSVATDAIFVGTDQFRLVFAADVAANGSNELFMSDFVSDPVQLTSATEGNLFLKAFAVSANGATVAYRREDRTAASTMDFWASRTATPNQKAAIPLPAGATLPLDANNLDQFIVSPDGQWIAFIARAASADSVYVANASTPTPTKVSPAGAIAASRLAFSRDSRNLYFLASSVAGRARTLYTVAAANPTATVPVSAVSDPATSDDVLDYAVAPDQVAILVQANRGGRAGLFFIDALHLQTEVQMNQTFGFGESLVTSTISLSGGTIGGALGRRIGYTVQTAALSNDVYAADVSATPNPRLIASGARAVGMRPDDGALLYAKSGQIFEHDLSAGTDTLVAAGANAWYDSTGNIVLVQQAQFSGLTPYPVLAVTARGSFPNTQTVGTPGQAARLIEVSGFDRGVALLGESAPTDPTPARARLALANGLAADKLYYPSTVGSPLSLTSATARVVTN